MSNFKSCSLRVKSIRKFPWEEHKFKKRLKGSRFCIFLVKNLLVHWRRGAEWFFDTLVDADLANNSAGWQWIAGCGADAAPYFRIFNPVTQAQKFDPRGVYIRRFVPEIAALPTAHLFAPWSAPPLVTAEAGIQLGKSYPFPIVDLQQSRQRALHAFAQVTSPAETPG